MSCPFYLLVAAGIPGLVATSLQARPLASHCFLVSVPLTRTLVIGVRAYGIIGGGVSLSHDPLLTYIGKDPFFQIKASLQVPGVGIWTYPLGDHHAAHYGVFIYKAGAIIVSAAKHWGGD